MKRCKIVFSLLLACTCFITGSCNEKSDIDNEQKENPEIDRYIVFFLTNTSIGQAVNSNEGKDANTNFNFISELPHLFGEISAAQPYKYAFGLPGPMLLTASVEEMRGQVNAAFDAAERYNVPVYFQLDDCTNYTTEFGASANPKFYENPDWVEWVRFPVEGESWGGELYGRPPYWWFNWGAWMHAEAFPNFESPGFRSFVLSQLEQGFLSVLTNRYEALKAKGKEYLFAGVAIGWETHIPDYSSDNPIGHVDKDNLPVDILTGDTMEEWEAGKFGYGALTALGKTEYDIQALYQVIHDYSELLAKKVFDAGIPKHKIFSHMVGLMSANPNWSTTFAPPIWAAVNDYCTPGFTLSPVTSPYDLNVLTQEIRKANPDEQYFGNAEGYARGVDDTYENAYAYFGDMFDNGALLVSVFGWGREPSSSAFAVSHSPNSPFVQAAKQWLNRPLTK